MCVQVAEFAKQSDFGDTQVTARKPRTRYTVGRDAALLTLMARILPDRILDRVIAAVLRPFIPKEGAPTI